MEWGLPEEEPWVGGCGEATGLKAKWLEPWAIGRIQPSSGVCFIP